MSQALFIKLIFGIQGVLPVVMSCDLTCSRAFILSCGFHQWLSGMIMDSCPFSRLHLVSERRVDACVKKMFVCLQMFSAH